MSLTNFVKWPTFEEYKEMFKEHFIMEKRDDGVLLVRMHTKGGPFLWSMELHDAIGKMWRIVGTDRDIECIIFIVLVISRLHPPGGIIIRSDREGGIHAVHPAVRCRNRCDECF